MDTSILTQLQLVQFLTDIRESWELASLWKVVHAQSEINCLSYCVCEGFALPGMLIFAKTTAARNLKCSHGYSSILKLKTKLNSSKHFCHWNKKAIFKTKNNSNGSKTNCNKKINKNNHFSKHQAHQVALKLKRWKENYSISPFILKSLSIVF